MSNERFDRLMRKNLEEVRPTYQPHAWSRFRKRLPNTGLGPWLLQYGGWLLSGLMLTGWLTTLYVLHENQLVLEQVNDKLATVSPPTAPAPALQLVHTDTVYVVKRTVVEHRYVPQPPVSAVADNRKNAIEESVTARQSDTVTEQIGSPRASLSQSGTERPASQPAGANVFMAESKQASPITSVIVPQNAATAGPTKQAITGQGNNKRLTAQQRTVSRSTAPAPVATTQHADTPAAVEDKVNTIVLSKTDSIATTISPSAKTDSLAQQSVAQETPAEKPAAAPKATQPSQKAPEGPKQSRPPFHLSSIKPRLGFEASGAINGVGVGPMLEVFPMDNLGISFGLQASALFDGNHHELRDFYSATGQQFIDKYKAYLPTQYDQIREISIQTSLISLPVGLKYYVPLRRQWSLLFQTGTRFDLASYQEVRYESYWQGEDQHHSFETGVKSPFFHNFMFGAGLQYRRSRVSAQLTPYYVYDFRRREPNPVGSNFGVKASVWVNLFK